MGAGRRWLLPGAIRAAAPLYAGLAVTFAAGFALKALLVAHVLRGPADMARFETLDRALQGLVTVSLLGLPAAVLRLAPSSPARQARLARAAIVAAVVAWAAGFAAILFVPPVRTAVLGDVSRMPFALYGVRGPFLAVIAVVSALLHVRGRFAQRGALDAAERVAALGFVAVAGAAIGGVAGAAAGCLAATIAAAAFAVRLAPAGAPPQDDAGSWRDDLRDLLAVGRPQLAMTVLEALRPLVVIRLAFEIADDEVAGLLATAMAFTLPLIALPEIASQALFPSMTGPGGERAHVEGERRRMVREMLVAGVPVLAAYGAAAAWLLPLAKQGAYAAAVPAVLALLPGVLAHGVTAHAGYVLLLRDRLRAAAWASACTLVAAAGAAAFAVPRWGAVGGAAALSAALVVRGCALLVIARRSAR